MTDVDLLIFGCVVSFVAWAGMYIYIREQFTGEKDRGLRTAPVRNESPDAGSGPRSRRAA